MKYTFLTVFTAGALLTVSSCKTKKGGDSSVNTTETSSTTTTAQVQPEIDPWTYDEVANSVDFKGMNPEVDPKVDFYEFANGTWVKNNPVPETESRWSNFNVLQESNNQKLKSILEEAAGGKWEKGSVNQLIGDYYFTYMDSAKRDKEGTAPILEDLQKIDRLQSKKDLAKLLAYFHNHGIDPLFGMGVEQDLKDINKHMLYISQGGLLLPSKEYYFKTDEASVELRKKYVTHLSKMFGFINYKPGSTDAAAAAVLKIETGLADSSMSPVELRNIEAQYNKMSLADFKKLTPSFNWDVYLKERGYTNLNELVVSQPAFMKNMEKMINEVSLADWKHYLKIHFFEAVASKLSSDIEAENFAFFSTTMRGTKKMKKRWERAVSSIGWTALGEALGHAFVDKHFQADSKKKVDEMVDNIMLVFRERLDGLVWMSDATKQKALEKLNSFTRKLGYPDKWTDYSSLTIDRTSYYKNWMASNAFRVKQNTDKLGKPIDRSEWQMAPHIVNAYYNPLWNEIVFPAGIMQPPFFDPTKEDAVNYARMGAVIGHEFLHGFDDQGAQFDATGAFNNWWTESDSKQFNERTQKLIDQFNEFEPLPGVKVNGELTLGENIADFGGLTIAFYAYKRSLMSKKMSKINGFTPDQRFFISFAQVWRENHTESSMKHQVFTNPHAPGKYRVLGPLANMPEFFSAFNVKEGDPMRRSEDKISIIW